MSQQIGVNSDGSPILGERHRDLVGDQLHPPKVHGHVIDDVSELGTILSAKSNASHDHDDDYSSIGHGHVINDVSGLGTILSAKSDTAHNHDISYSPIGHNHLTSNIVDWDQRFWETLKTQLAPVYPPVWTYYDDPNRVMYIGSEGSEPESRNMAIARHILPANTPAGSAPDDTWYDRELNDLVVSSAWGASLSNNLLTLPAGTYAVDWWIRQPPVRELRAGVFDGGNNPLLNQVGSDLAGGYFWRTPIGSRDLLVLPGQTQIKLRAWHNYAVGGYSGNNKGVSNTSPPSFDTTISNTYSLIKAEKIA